jgi:hypothetical protein
MNKVRRKVLLAILVPIGVFAVALTAYTGHEAGITDWMAEVGTYISAFAYMVLVVAFMYLINACEVPEEDFVDVIASDPKALAIWLGLLALAFAVAAKPAFGQKTGPRSAIADTLCAYEGVTEQPKNSNRGPEVERFLASVGLGPGYPYCAAAASYAAKQAGVSGPVAEKGPYRGQPIRSALSAHFTHARTFVSARVVARGDATIPRGSIAIWLKGNSGAGHTGVVLGDDTQQGPWRGRCGRTIEANTTPSAEAPAHRQREGGGVWSRVRCYHPHSYFRLIGFAVPQ